MRRATNPFGQYTEVCRKIFERVTTEYPVECENWPKTPVYVCRHVCECKLTGHSAKDAA